MRIRDEFWFNFTDERWAIGPYDLHCGDCFELFDGYKWVPLRIEHNSNGWYLVGAQNPDPNFWDRCEARI